MKYIFVCDVCNHETTLRKGISDPFPEVVCDCGAVMHQKWTSNNLEVPDEMKAENVQGETYIRSGLINGYGLSGERHLY